MLIRIACRPCHIQSLWTDDPQSFLESVCHHRKGCHAKLTEEGCLESRALLARKPTKPLPAGVDARLHRRSAVIA
jgi:hypothetical protein